jgi:NAD+ dependent glucose-6-phosphate dehydrogenase
MSERILERKPIHNGAAFSQGHEDGSMSLLVPLTVVITGAAGNIGGKLRAHLRARGEYITRLVDVEARGDAEIFGADLANYDERWSAIFAGADAVVHLAANGDPAASWDKLLGPNIDASLNIYLAAARHGVKRVVLASSVWAVASRFDDKEPILAGEPSPGSNPYGATKLFAERIGKTFARVHGISTVALRLGHCRPGANEPGPASSALEDAYWISNGDICNGLECAIRADVRGFSVVNLISANPGSRWSLAEARDLLGYHAVDGYTPRPRAEAVTMTRERLGFLGRLRARVAGAR